MRADVASLAADHARRLPPGASRPAMLLARAEAGAVERYAPLLDLVADAATAAGTGEAGARFDDSAAAALRGGAWLGDLRVRPGQSIGPSTGSPAPTLTLDPGDGPAVSAAQRRGLAGLAALRDALAAATAIEVVPVGDEASVPARVLAALGGDRSTRSDDRPVLGPPPLDGPAPLLAVAARGHLVVSRRPEPWAATAAAQARRSARADALALGALVMAADAGHLPVPAGVLLASGLAAVTDRTFQEDRLAGKLAHWSGLAADLDV